MELKRGVYLILFVLLILALCSCHPRHIADVKVAMTKEDVIALWGPTNLITYNKTNGTVIETWEYHFATTNTVCWVTFIQDRVAAPQKCHRTY